jgi:hypothetical protein
VQSSWHVLHSLIISGDLQIGPQKKRNTDVALKFYRGHPRPKSETRSGPSSSSASRSTIGSKLSLLQRRWGRTTWEWCTRGRQRTELMQWRSGCLTALKSSGMTDPAIEKLPEKSSF